MKLFDIDIIVRVGELETTDVDAIVIPIDEKFHVPEGFSQWCREEGIRAQAIVASSLESAMPASAFLIKSQKGVSTYCIFIIAVNSDYTVNEALIRECAKNIFALVHQHAISSVAMPSLLWSPFKFTHEAVSKIVAQEVFRYARQHPMTPVRKIIFTLPTQDQFLIFQNNVEYYLQHMTRKMEQGPYLTVDGIVEYENKVVLVQRKNPPLGWALPGGFVDYGESVQHAVVREVKEETDLDFKDIVLLGVYSAPGRDPRFHTVSVVFYGKGHGFPRADSDAQDCGLFDLRNLPGTIAFDHRDILLEYLITKEIKEK